MAKKVYRIAKVPHLLAKNFTKAHLEIYGIDHFRPSYDAQVFFNDPEVTAESASEERATYAGGFAIFGHATCYGGEDHCAVPSQLGRFEVQRSHPLTKAFKRFDVTTALRTVAEVGDAIDITIVVASDYNEETELAGPLFSCQGMQLVTFQ